jgi:GT2 family glycosyltransferase
MTEGSGQPRRKSTRLPSSAIGTPVPAVTVVIPTYKRPARLAGCIGALRNQLIDPARVEVIAVDNCSEDDTFDTLVALSATVPFTMRVLQTDSNHGPAPARNLGWLSASAPVVVFLDDDCLPEPDWLANGLAVMEADEALGVLQGRVRPPRDVDMGALPPWSHWQVIDAPTPYFEACNIFYRRAALVEVGGFDESIGWWGEDTALGWRVIEAGWGRGFTAKATVEHDVVLRGWKWHFVTGHLERANVQLAKAHPGFRAEAFWRPWAFRRQDAGFVFFVVGLLIGLRFRPALLLAAPYLWWKRPRALSGQAVAVSAQGVAVDAARTVSQLRAAVTHRVWVI